MSSQHTVVRLLDAFDDPACAPNTWDVLLPQGDTDVVFLTSSWQHAWWDVFGRGRLLLLFVERDNRPIALAPLFSDCGMVFFVGSGGSDYLDFVGDIGESDVLTALLRAAQRHTPDFVGFRFFHVPDSSRTGDRLQAVADQLGLVCFDEGNLPAPALDLRDDASAQAAPNKKSLRRHTNALSRLGTVTVRHLRDAPAIREQLAAFFSQHVARWTETPYPSLFLDPQQRAFYEHMTEAGCRAGWLRFCRIDVNGAPVAFHLGSCYKGRYLWYKPTFDVELAKYSPGEVLLRHLLLAAIDEGAHTFDFGLGDELFKQRFASHTPRVRTWGLYPRGQRWVVF